MGEFPSREHQYKPGNSGNPGGRPRGISLVRELLDELASTAPTVDGPGGEETTRARRVVREWLRLAIQGDLSAIRMMIEHVDGKPKQAIALEAVDTIKDALIHDLRQEHECPPSSSPDRPSEASPNGS